MTKLAGLDAESPPRALAFLMEQDRLTGGRSTVHEKCETLMRLSHV